MLLVGDLVVQQVGDAAAGDDLHAAGPELVLRVELALHRLRQHGGHGLLVAQADPYPVEVAAQFFHVEHRELDVGGVLGGQQDHRRVAVHQFGEHERLRQAGGHLGPAPNFDFAILWMGVFCPGTVHFAQCQVVVEIHALAA